MTYYTETDIIIRNTLVMDYMSEYAERIANAIKNGSDVECHIDLLILLTTYQEIINCYPVYGDAAFECCLTEEQLDNIFEQIQDIGNICFPPKGQSYLEPCYLLLEDGGIVLWEDFGGCELEICNN